MTASFSRSVSATLLSFAIVSAPVGAAPKRAKPAPAKAASLPPRLYDIRGFKLEMPLEDFRKSANPDWPQAKVVCNGDTDEGKKYAPYVSDEETKRGIRKCVWWQTGSYSGVVGLALGPMGTMQYEFSFVKDPIDSVDRLYSYFATIKAFAFGEILELLTEKYGKPAMVAGSVQNGLGAKFDSREAMWANSLSILNAKERWLSVDQMAIMLTSNRLLKVAEPGPAKKNAV